MTENSLIHASIEKLSIADKYFSLKKEQRINRMQFFVRNITGTLLGLVPFVVIALLIITGQLLHIMHPVGEWTPVIPKEIIIVGILTPMYIWYINIRKRTHDYGSPMCWYNLLLILFFPLTVPMAHIILGNFFNAMLSGHGGGASPFWMFIVLICLFIVQLIAFYLLQFRKGNSKSNQYGPAPTGKPLV